jgi:hypothetical protein
MKRHIWALLTVLAGVVACFTGMTRTPHSDAAMGLIGIGLALFAVTLVIERRNE